MSSNDSSTRPWHSVAPCDEVEIGVVHVEITYHRQGAAEDSAVEIGHLKDFVKECFQAVAEHRGSKLLTWGENGGAFMFLVEDRESYDNCSLAAIQMLEMMPSLNQDLRSSNDAVARIEVRISCDAGLIAYNPEPSNIPGDFVKRLAHYGRQASTSNAVTITDRVYRQLTPACQGRFEKWKHSAELDDHVYRTSPFGDTAAPQEPKNSSRRKAPSAEKAPKAAAKTSRRPKRRPAVRHLRQGVGRIGRWQMAVVGLVALLFAEFFIVRAIVPPAAPPAAAAAAAWKEHVRSPEWTAWREQIDEKFSSEQMTEETLAETLRVRPPAVRNPPAAALRCDLAIGDVLESYPRVRAFLEKRCGITEQFLGTGFSNPASAQDYESATLHEYLIPNVSDDDGRIWMRKINLGTYAQALDKTIKDLIEGKGDEDAKKQDFKKSFIAHATAGDRERVMVRFAILDKKLYKNELGRHERERVFACDLAEVWELKVKQAARRSGYTFSGGDTFFIWVFVPVHEQEAVLATWGQVVEHLPKWLESAQNKGR